MKVGVIGCGAIARRAHLPAYRRLGVDIMGVADLREDRAMSCAKKFHAKKCFTQYEDLLEEELDLVSICTPHSTHARIAVDAAKHGINVLVEKPLATNLVDADRIIRACRDSAVQLCVMHNLRLVPCIPEAKNHVENGRIGRIVSMHVIGRSFMPMSWTDSTWFYSKWGLLEDIGSHLLDVINFICNSPLKDVKVIARDFTNSMGFLSHIQTILLFENKVCADLDLSWISGSFESSLRILGTAGTLDVDIRNNYLREMHGYVTPIDDISSAFRKLHRTAKAVINKSYFRGSLVYHQTIIKAFIESILNRTPPPISGKQGRAVVALMDSIKKAKELV